MLTYKQTSAGNRSQTVISYAAIGTGSLSLSQPEFCTFAPQLREELLILAHNTRPDFQRKEAELLMQLKSTREQRAVVSGTPLYLKEEENLLKFSSTPTDFWVKPLIAESGDLLIVAGKGEEKAQWIASGSEHLGKRVGDRFWDKDSPSFLSGLREAKCWGLDLLVQQYAGKEHQLLRDKHKLILGNAVFFVAPGDYLTWSNGSWSLCPLAESCQGTPLAYIKSISSRELEIDAWDVTGFQMYQIKVDLSHPTKMGVHADQLPSSIRLRTSSQVACTLGKRRLILKEGDWLLRTSAGWRKLKTAQEIEDCLLHKIMGELFIFDKLEKQQGKNVLHAHFFDEMRTQVQTLAIPILAEKKKTSGGKI